MHTIDGSPHCFLGHLLSIETSDAALEQHLVTLLDNLEMSQVGDGAGGEEMLYPASHVSKSGIDHFVPS